jgi:hypothetical protein
MEDPRWSDPQFQRIGVDQMIETLYGSDHFVIAGPESLRRRAREREREAAAEAAAPTNTEESPAGQPSGGGTNSGESPAEGNMAPSQTSPTPTSAIRPLEHTHTSAPGSHTLQLGDLLDREVFSGHGNLRPVGYSIGLPNAEPETRQLPNLPNLLPPSSFGPLGQPIAPPVDPNIYGHAMNLDEGNILVNSDYPEVPLIGTSRPPPPLMITENGDHPVDGGETRRVN